MPTDQAGRRTQAAPSTAAPQQNAGLRPVEVAAPEPVGISDVTESDIFLTPRVIDQGAFSEYSAALKKLVTDAGASGRELSANTSKARSLCGDVREVSEDLRKAMETAVRLIPTLDQRAKKAEGLLAEATDVADQRAEHESKFEARVNEIVEAAMGKIDARLDQITAAEAKLRATLTEIEDKPASIETRAEEVIDGLEEKVGDLETRAKAVSSRSTALASLCDRIEKVSGETGFADLVERAENLSAGAQHATKQLESITQQADQARSILGEALLEAAEKIDAVEARKTKLTKSLSALVDAAASEGPAIERHIESLESRLGDLTGRGSSLQSLAEQANAAAERAEQSLRLIEQRSAQQQRELRAAAEGVISPFTTQVEQMGGWLGELIKRAERVATEANAAAQAIEQAAASLPTPSLPTPGVSEPEAISDAVEALLETEPEVESIAESPADDASAEGDVRFRAVDSEQTEPAPKRMSPVGLPTTKVRFQRADTPPDGGNAQPNG